MPTGSAALIICVTLLIGDDIQLTSRITINLQLYTCNVVIFLLKFCCTSGKKWGHSRAFACDSSHRATHDQTYGTGVQRFSNLRDMHTCTVHFKPDGCGLTSLVCSILLRATCYIKHTQSGCIVPDFDPHTNVPEFCKSVM